ncbi:hypothetical protein SPTER_32780 [Sporomusa termitida]|uniref:Uncharacterized protein n=1 Tax=Sporomusa termitida TaxID=2377 RepID=A0A517DWX7_9FIRM|nr:hypothetical protein SPTER_32780 [Sporomusa termitida]
MFAYDILHVSYQMQFTDLVVYASGSHMAAPASGIDINAAFLWDNRGNIGGL